MTHVNSWEPAVYMSVWLSLLLRCMLTGGHRARALDTPLLAPGTELRAVVLTPAQPGMSRAAPYAPRTSRPAAALLWLPGLLCAPETLMYCSVHLALALHTSTSQKLLWHDQNYYFRSFIVLKCCEFPLRCDDGFWAKIVEHYFRIAFFVLLHDDK